MRALDMLSQKNGLKTTQSVLNKQQSGVDAAQKANPQEASTFTQKQLDAAGKKVDQANDYTPETPTMKEAQTRTIANQQGVMNGIQTNGGVDAEEQDKPSIPIVKKDEKSQQEQPRTRLQSKRRDERNERRRKHVSLPLVMVSVLCRTCISLPMGRRWCMTLTAT